MWGYLGQMYCGGVAWSYGGGGADFAYEVTDSATAAESVAEGNTVDLALAVGDLADAHDLDVDVDLPAAGESATAGESAVADGLEVPTDREVTDSAVAGDTASAEGLAAPPPPPPTPVSTTSAIKFVRWVGDEDEVRLDLTAHPYRVLKEFTEWPPAEVADQRASSMLVDGERVVASAARNRTLRMRIMINAATAELAATAIQALDRELDRETNVLWFQPDVTTPRMWFRTYRSPDYRTDLDFGVRTHTFDVEIECEPYALGDETTIEPLDFPRDPATGAAPCSVDLPTIKGDVATELYLTTAAVGLSARRVAIAVRSRGNPAAVTWFRQAESLTLGADAAVNGNVLSSGGSQVVVSFASGGADALRLSGSFPAAGTGSEDWAGDYRIFVRARVSNDSTAVTLRGGTAMGLNLPVPMLSGDLSATAFAWWDLGVVTLPYGNPGRAAGYGRPHRAAGGTLHINAQRTAGSGTFIADTVFIMPTDERYALVTTSQIGGGSAFVIDGPNGDVYPVNSAGEIAPPGVVVPEYDGGLPVVRPGGSNRLFLLAGVGTIVNMAGAESLPSTGSLTLSDQVNVTYWPKYQTIRPDLT